MEENSESKYQQNILLDHVILPRVLPQHKSCFTHQQALIDQLIDSVDNISDVLPQKTGEMMKRLKRVHSECTPTVVSELINELRSGDTFAMFVRKQNTAVLFYVPNHTGVENVGESDNVIVATFPGSLHPRTVYSNESDVEFNYPEQAYNVKFSKMLRSKHFANQLCVLHDAENMKNKDYISKWLITLLIDEKSTTASTDQCPVITKKIRDEALGKMDKNFFRRSSYYMCVKVMLQHSLTIQLGPELGRFVYKIVMLNFLVELCTDYKEPDCEQFDIDLMSQMITKIARRIDKLCNSMPPAATMTEDVSQLYDVVISEAKDTIQVIRHIIDTLIEDIQNEDSESAHLSPMVDLNFEADSLYKMPKLLKFLHEHAKKKPPTESHSKHKIASYHRRPKRGNRRAVKVNFHANKMSESIDWTDYENLVLYEMMDVDEDYAEFYELFDYVKYVEKTYIGNPVMFSRMVLVVLKLIQLFDQHLVMNAYPMLEHHQSGINSNIINILLIPQRIDMDVAYELEQYFQERNEHASDPALIENVVTKRSFSVKYAKENQQMCQLRDQILQLDEKNIEDMKIKCTNGRNRAQSLRETADKTDHFRKITLLGKSKHVRKRCPSCKLRDKADAIRYEQYEHLLPTEEYEQFGVVFELRIPNEIALLRKMLFEFSRICAIDRTNMHIKGDWTERKDISQFNVPSPNQFVTLGSTKCCQRVTYHVDEPFDKFVIPNSFNLIYHVNSVGIPTSLDTNELAKNMLTFKMQNEYECLQWTVDGTLHTQNQVLAKQSDCPQPVLSLLEFKNFGSLRADGHRLQLRKLYGMLQTEALSFDKESVLLLIMQTLWQCGISGYGESIRESHMDFNEPKFCTAMIELLEEFIEKHKDNWMHPFKLLTATLIAIRAFEINETKALANEIVCRLLKKIRTIAVSWIDKINNVINGTQNLHANDGNNLRLKLMYAAIVGGMTFSIPPEHTYFNYIVMSANNNDDVTWKTPQFWLHFIITLDVNAHLYERIETNEDRTMELPATLCVFRRFIEIGGIHLEPTMHKLIEQNETKVYQTIAQHCSNIKYARRPGLIYFDEEFQHVLIIVVWENDTKSEINVDIITGNFMVNGSPLSRLPSEVTENEMYRSCFGNKSMAVQTNSENHFSSVYNNFNYEFRKYDQELIITETRPDGLTREIIFYKNFEGDFPDSLVFNYHHWWNKRDNCIEFHKHQPIGQPNYSTDADIDYRLDLNTRHLVHVKSNRRMLDITSNSFAKITNHLARLEHANYIHVMLEASNVAIVELLRMKLKFRLDCSNKAKSQTGQGFQLQSFEFDGMCVSLNQKVGTLYGLNHGLVLESSAGESTSKPKIMLIPHGSIRVRCVDQIAAVDIDVLGPNIRNPPFYHYQVEERLQQLKASDSSHSAWFYLAYLHAVTSHLEPEPLTGMSGTERALQILQSAFAWSSSPYEPEASSLLHLIADLSPCRKKINFHQIVEWPTHVPHHCAQDSFVFIVKKLIEDSQRLYGLHLTSPMQKFEFKTDLVLNQRDYLRCLQLQPNLRVSDAFIEHKILKTSLAEVEPISFSRNAQMVSILYHNQNYHMPTATNLKAFLTKANELQGARTQECIPNILNHNQYEKFVDLWIRLYDVARNQEQLNREEFALVLSLFAHQNELISPNESISPILALQAVAQNPQAFESIDPPSVDEYQISHGIYDAIKVTNLLEKHYPKYELNIDFLLYNLAIGDDSFTRNEIIKNLATNISQCWPCDSVELSQMCTQQNVNEIFLSSLDVVNAELNCMLTIWYDNYRLHKFIDKVEMRLKSLAQAFTYEIPTFHPFVESIGINWQKHAIDVDSMVQERLREIENLICEAKYIWRMDEDKKEKKAVSRSSNEWWKIIEQTFITPKTEHLVQTGLIERMVPSLFLQKLLNTNTNADLKALIGAWAIAISREQHQTRVDAQLKNSGLETTREVENKPHMNWKPCEYPEWLLFEIEQNLTIRRIQIEIAKRMISPPNDDRTAKHSVMQLNMGEGKTAVIVPILAAVLADGNQACQITVLKSLFTRNLKFLRQYLGGLLNRRMYIFPCRRDMEIHEYIDQIMDLHEECKMQKGVILTLPEYRLSLQLKTYEFIKKDEMELAKDEMEIAKHFLDVHKWINANVRNILDESDAILHPNYQLIYTIGNRLSPDGGSLRWSVAQAVFKRIPHHMELLYRQHGTDKIEFDDRIMANVQHRAIRFPKCRILDESIFDDLKAALIDDFLNARFDINFVSIDEWAKPWLKKILSEKEIDAKTFQKINNYSPTDQNTIMILSGLLRLEVLKLALTKRWRVNFGVDPNGKRKMAIPFRAKDVAADTEFGHPDVAICLTQLSYYYSGLSVEQLHKLFSILEKEPNRIAIYEKWIKDIPHLNASIQSFTTINIDDPNQRDKHLFPLLQFNMHAIDFWLNKMVYPHESKIYEQKLMCTAWDLCSDRLQHCVTGFSGTNDTKDILPMPIAQNDLTELENTNDNMRQILLRRENQSYDCLPANVSGIQILDWLARKSIPVLLDSGAIMLELTNKDVAMEWLKRMSGQYEAAVYFDAQDTLQTIDRNGVVNEFDSSIYRENLNRCLVYLDDVHTRGTDLKFPPNWKACVTLCGDITRDKTVQSCMRMRQLGHHHSICFLASYEANIRIQKICGLSEGRQITNEHVIEFVCNNSKQFETTNMVHWMVASLNYSKKLVAHELYENSVDKTDMQNLYRICVDNEFIKLEETYGDKNQALLTNIASSKFDKLIAQHKTNKEIRSLLSDFKWKVFDKIQAQAPHVLQFSNSLDEEQEKELEQEVEEQRSVERVPIVEPAAPEFDKRLKQLVTNGVTDYNTIEEMIEESALFSIGDSLTLTQLFQPYMENADAWANHLFATRDFVRVLADESSKSCDDFLRPVWWIAKIQHCNDKCIVLLLSTYECEHLLPIFSKSTKSSLLMYRSRLSKYHRKLLNEPKLRITGMNSTQSADVDLDDTVQIGMYACSMYFDSEAEQNAYCAFMGLIPNPRTPEQNRAHANGIITSNGYVPFEHRERPELISSCVSKSKFQSNPVQMAIELIEARHQTMLSDSHVAWILEKGKKQTIEHSNGQQK